MPIENTTDQIDTLKRALLTMPEHTFFSIARTYLGEVRTPFHKPAIADNLTSFLLRPQTREAVVAGITKRDAEFLTAVAVLEEPAPDALYTFFEGEKPFFEIQRHIANLIERLLILRAETTTGPRLILNPVLSAELTASILDSGILFPSVPVSPEGQPAAQIPVQEPWLNETLAAAFLSFLSGRNGLFRNDGTIRKQAERELREAFPILYSSEHTAGPAATGSGSSLLQDTDRSRLTLLLSSLKNCGLVRESDGRISPDREGIERFSRIPGRERTLLLWGGGLEGGGEVPEKGAMVFQFMACLRENEGYGTGALVRCGRAASIRYGFPPQTGSTLHIHAAELNLIVPSGDSLYRINPAAGRLAGIRAGTENSDPARGALLPNFELALAGTLPFPVVWETGQFCDIKKADNALLFLLTKESVFRGFRNGVTHSEIMERIAEVTGTAPSQNIGFSLSTWAREYETLRIYEGTVMIVEENRRYLVEHSASFGPYIAAILGPGIYLLNPAERDEWSRVLKDLGFDPLPAIQKPADGEKKRSRVPSPTGPAMIDTGSLPARYTPSSPSPYTGAAACRKTLLAALEALHLPAERKNDLEGKIRSGIVLFPEQLSYPFGGKEKTEARGIDYAGKVRLIEQALSSGEEYVDAVERLPNGDPKHWLLRPLRLERSGSELYLVGAAVPGNEEIRIRVGKLGLVRKIRGSDFIQGE